MYAVHDSPYSTVCMYVVHDSPYSTVCMYVVHDSPYSTVCMYVVHDSPYSTVCMYVLHSLCSIIDASHEDKNTGSVYVRTYMNSKRFECSDESVQNLQQIRKLY